MEYGLNPNQNGMFSSSSLLNYGYNPGNSMDLLTGSNSLSNFSGMDGSGITGAAAAPTNMSWGSPGMGQAINLGIGGIQGIAGLANAYLGMKNYGLAKDTLASNKQQYWNNFTSQARLTNAQLRDRQMERNRNYGDSTPVAEYMAQNGIDEKGYR